MVLDMSSINFDKFLGDLITDKKGRVKVDPNTGEFIAKDDRRKEKAVRRNPLGLTPGNTIDPEVDFAQIVLGKSNQSFDGGQSDILKRALG